MKRTIGVLAKEVGISVETIRFYEKQGLIEQPFRSANGFRMYPDSTINQLLLIFAAQNFGFTLHEIKDMVDTSDNVKKTVGKFASDKLVTHQASIDDLKQ
jgi:MerR family mercuric resistance operon transcriptional regulator